MRLVAAEVSWRTHLSKAVVALIVASFLSVVLASSAYALTPTSQKYTQTQLGYQVVPVTLQAGAVKLDFEAGASSADAGIYATADTEGNYSGMVVSTYTSDPYAKDSRYGTVAKSGTYYLRFYASAYSGKTGSTATVTQYPYANVTSARLNASTLGTGCGDNSRVVYYKLDVGNRGYLTVNVLDATLRGNSASVQLCDAKKRSYSGTNFTYVSEGRPAYFGVKKGTYYLAVKSYAPLYNVNPSFTAVTKAVKSSKGKAALIKKGKTASAVMAAGEKTAWYKFKVTKSKVCKITITGKLSDTVKMTFSGKNYYNGTASLYAGQTSQTVKTNKLKKGTYYVQVTPYSSGNGFYSIKWK